MIQLSDHETDQAARIARAGPSGVHLGDRLPVSTAIRLSLAGLATITPGDDQRAVATKQASYLRNRTYA